MNLLSRRFETPCVLDIACDADSVHAHVLIDGVELGPADRVRVHQAPDRIGFGERRTVVTRATVTRAGLLARTATRLSSALQLTDLYEVSFSPGRPS